MAELRGKLRIEDLGYTMPVHDPDIGPPPYFYRQTEIICVDFETDYDTASYLLPEDLSFAHNPPRASIIFSKYPFCSGLGTYNEFALFTPVLFENKQYIYAVSLFVTQETPLIAGREIWGIPKKCADVIEIKSTREEIVGYLERPAGNRLCTVVMRPDTNLNKEDLINTPEIFMKLIPHPTLGQKPEICELVELKFQMTPIVGTDGMAELWSGKGSVVWDSPTAIDPLYKVPIKNVIRCIYGWVNCYLPDGKIVKRYV